MGAPTEVYVDPAIAGNSGSGTIGDPYGDLQWALDNAGRDAVNGDRFNIKAGTDEILAASLDFSTYGAPTEDAPWIMQGYTSAAGDGGIGGVSGNGGNFSIIGGDALDWLQIIDMHCHNTGTADVFSIDNDNAFVNCEIDNTTANGIEGDQRVKIFDCHIHNCGGMGIYCSYDGYIAFNTLENGTNDFTIAIRVGGNSASGFVMENIVNIDGSTDGLYTTGDGVVFIRNSIYSSGGTGEGINIHPFASNIIVLNNIVEGFSGAGGDGILTQAGSKILMYGYNAFYNNTTNLSQSGDVVLDWSANDQALSASPFINAAAGNFKVSTAVKALGYPTANYPNLSVRTFLDIGALQRAEPAGGGASPSDYTSGVNPILEAFQAVHRGIDGVKKAPDPKWLPRSLNDDDLPFVLCIPGPAEWNEQAVGYDRQNREVIVRCFVKPVQQGEDIGPALQVTNDLMGQIALAYLDDTTMGGNLDHIIQPFSDGGIEALEYAGNLYHGFEFRVEVTQKG